MDAIYDAKLQETALQMSQDKKYLEQSLKDALREQKEMQMALEAADKKLTQTVAQMASREVEMEQASESQEMIIKDKERSLNELKSSLDALKMENESQIKRICELVSSYRHVPASIHETKLYRNLP